MTILTTIEIYYLIPDYMENKAIKMGLEKLFLLTTRTADWLVLATLILIHFHELLIVIFTCSLLSGFYKLSSEIHYNLQFCFSHE